MIKKNRNLVKNLMFVKSVKEKKLMVKSLYKLTTTVVTGTGKVHYTFEKVQLPTGE